MFTPQKKLWSLSPRSEPFQNKVPGHGSDPNLSPRNGETLDKGKGVALLESTHRSLTGLLGQNGGTMDQETVLDKVSKLENELFEYQYNMGLILLEKKEWISRYEEIGQVLAETKDTLKQEQVAHLIAISEVEKREENLQNKLGVEKQCVLDLEKVLSDKRSEYAEIKFTADSKLAEAGALVSSIEEKSLEVEAKLLAADAKLAEVSRKSSEIERKLHELGAQENALRRERLSFITEQETREATLSKHREDFQEWERKLLEGEERLSESQRLLNLREQRANENDKMFKIKQSEFENVQKKIDLANSNLKNKEDEISSKLTYLTSKGEEADNLRKSLELREKALVELEEKLNARERGEIQKLLDEHTAILDEKNQQFELEMKEKQKSLSKDLKCKVVEVEKKEIEVNHMEDKIARQEKLLEKKLDKVKEKEEDLESKLKAIEEKVKYVQVEKKYLENERNQMLADKEDLLGLKVELENMRADIEKQLLKINEDKDQLKITEEERSEHIHLHSELKQEIENCRHQRELLLKEAEDLKSEREKFEKEWEELDEKGAEIRKELENLTMQKEKFEKLKHSEEERLINEKLESKKYIQRELEGLKLAKDSFASEMEHEKLLLVEKTRSEESQRLHDFELQKRKFETEMHRQKEMEHHLHAREASFEEEKGRELNNIKYLRDVAQNEMEDMNSEKLRIRKEKEEISSRQKHLEEQKLGIQKDVDDLVDLSRKLKDQRERFVMEREHFIASINKQKTCKNCGTIICDFVLSDLQPLGGMDSAGAFPLQSLAGGNTKEVVQGTTSGQPNSEKAPGVPNLVSPSSGGTMSWLRRCTTKIFKFSPGKKIDFAPAQELTDVIPSGGNQTSVGELHKRLLSTDIEPELSFGMEDDSFDKTRIQSDSSIKDVEPGQDPSVDTQSNINSEAQEIEEVHRHSDLQLGQCKPGKKVRSRGNRTRSVKATDAKAIPSDTFELNGSEYANTKVDNVSCMNDGSCVESSHVNVTRAPRNGRKRHRAPTSQTTASELDGDYSDDHSGSVATASRRRRRKVAAAALQTPGESRYNLRRHKKLATMAANGALSQRSEGKGKEVNDGGSVRDEICNSTVVLSLEFDGGGGTREVNDAPAAEVACENDVQLRSTNVLNQFPSNGNTFNLEADNRDGDIAEKPVDDIIPSGCLDRTPEYRVRKPRSETPGDVDDEEDSCNDEEEEEAEHPGEVSVRKKLWTFLTT